MEVLTFMFTRERENERTWRYHDPFVGALDLRKVDLPDPPPTELTVTVEAKPL